MKKILLSLFTFFAVFAAQAQSKTTGVVNLLAGMTAQLELNNTTSTATLTFTGPADRWFALQFGSFATGGGMQDGQDLVYYNGTTLVDAVHNGVGATPSTDAVNNWTVVSATPSGASVIIVATRPFNTGSADDYTFVYSNTDIDFAFSRSQTASYALAYHGTNRGYALNRTFSCVAPSAPNASAQTFCSGATVANLTATGAAGATFNWYTAPTGGTALATTTVVSTGNYYVSQTADACESARTAVAVTVTTVAAPTASAQTLCIGATIANLTATGTTGATFSWYTASTGGAALSAGTALTTGNYYVSQTVSTCESSRTTVAVTISNPASPTASAQTLCSGATVANLTATGAAGATFNWYAAPAGGNALAGTTALTSGNYYVSQSIGTCESGRTAVAVTVNTVAAPTAAAQEFCSGATASSLVATGTGTFNWYSASTGGTALAGTTILATGNYYVSQTIDTCESTRIPVAVTVNTIALPVAPSVQVFCEGALVSNLTATGAAGAPLNWYATAAGGTPLTGDTALTTGNYYVSQTLGECESARVTVAVTVTSLNEPTAANQIMCEGQTVADLMATGVTGATFNWYLTSAGGTALNNGTVLVAGDYYVSQSLNTCESDRALVSVTLNPVPDAPAGETTQQFTAGETVSSLEIVTQTGASVTWYTEDLTENLIEVEPTALLADDVVYYVTQTLNNCESDYLEITANEVLGNSAFTVANIVVYPNPVKDVLTIANDNIVHVSVYNLLGQEILNIDIEGERVIVDTSKLTAGSYILKATLINGESASVRIIKN